MSKEALNIRKNTVKKLPKTPLWRSILSKIVFALLVPAVSLAILFAVLYSITEEKHAKDTLSLVIATAFSQKGLDDESEIIDIKRRMDELKLDSVAPFEGLNIEITRADIDNLSPRDTRLKFFSKIADILYYQDKGQIDQLITSKDIKNNFENAAFLSTISKNGHKETGSWFIYALLASGFFGFGVYILNRGLNRIKIPAKAVMFASLPGLALCFIVKMFSASEAPASLSDETQFSSVSANIIKNVLPQTIDVFLRAYLWIFIVSASAYALIVIYALWRKLFRKKTSQDI